MTRSHDKLIQFYWSWAKISYITNLIKTPNTFHIWYHISSSIVKLTYYRCCFQRDTVVVKVQPFIREALSSTLDRLHIISVMFSWTSWMICIMRWYLLRTFLKSGIMRTDLNHTHVKSNVHYDVISSPKNTTKHYTSHPTHADKYIIVTHTWINHESMFRFQFQPYTICYANSTISIKELSSKTYEKLLFPCSDHYIYNQFEDRKTKSVCSSTIWKSCYDLGLLTVHRNVS